MIKHKIVLYALESQYVIPATRRFNCTRKRPKEKRLLNACVCIWLYDERFRRMVRIKYITAVKIIAFNFSLEISIVPRYYVSLVRSQRKYTVGVIQVWLNNIIITSRTVQGGIYIICANAYAKRSFSGQVMSWRVLRDVVSFKVGPWCEKPKELSGPFLFSLVTA